MWRIIPWLVGMLLVCGLAAGIIAMSAKTKRKKGRALLKAALIIEIFAAFFAFVPLGMNWVWGMILSMVAAIVYAVFWFIKLNDRNALRDDILLLFLPVFFYTGITIATTGGPVYFITTVVISLAAAVMSLISLLTRTESRKNRAKKKSIVFMGILALTFHVLAEVFHQKYLRIWQSSHYRTLSEASEDVKLLFYAPIGLLGILLIVYFILLLCSREKVPEKYQEDDRG